MTLSDDYRSNGYAHLPAFVPAEVATGILVRMKSDLARQGVTLDQLQKGSQLLASPAPELYAYHYPPFAFFLWGMTPAVEALVGEPLLPTYCYFRLYRQGDICRFHGDRPACEHSLSLTLGYSDDASWPLEVARHRTEVPVQRFDDGPAPEDDAASVPMSVGDAVLYQGVHHHHGRSTPNPNRWSGHLFLHWVARNGPYADQAFDGQPPPATVTF